MPPSTPSASKPPTAAGSPDHCLVSFERDGLRFDVALLTRH
jgi:hypothetical protein